MGLQFPPYIRLVFALEVFVQVVLQEGGLFDRFESRALLMAGLVKPVLRLVVQVAAQRAAPVDQVHQADHMWAALALVLAYTVELLSVAPGAVLALELLPEAVHTVPVAVRPAPLEAPHIVVAPAAVLVVLAVVPLLAVALETGFGSAVVLPLVPAVPLQILSLECIAL